MKSPDLSRLQTILSALQPDDAAWLANQLEPAWKSRERALAERDAAICAGFSHLSHLPRCPAARQLEHDLARYLSTAWRFDRDRSELPEDATSQRIALWRIARANGGKPIGWRQMLNLQDGHRG